MTTSSSFLKIKHYNIPVDAYPSMCTKTWLAVLEEVEENKGTDETSRIAKETTIGHLRENDILSLFLIYYNVINY